MGSFAKLVALVWSACRLGPSAELNLDGTAADTVELKLDLPSDVQRMFEEMCQMEGINASAMLTRWIDARWEAMGYSDADLEAFEAEERGESVCDAVSTTGLCDGRRQPSTLSVHSDVGGPPAARSGVAEAPSVGGRAAASQLGRSQTSVRASPDEISDARPDTRVAQPEKKTTPQQRSARVHVEEQVEETEEDEEDEEDGLMDLDAWMERRSGQGTDDA